jgi:hypothetical protein
MSHVALGRGQSHRLSFPELAKKAHAFGCGTTGITIMARGLGMRAECSYGPLASIIVVCG